MEAEIKLNLGCGWRNFGPTWTHIDGGTYPHLNSKDIFNLPYEDETVYSGTDTALIEVAKKEKGCVFTFDKKLKYRCRSRDIPVISLYKPGTLQLTGEIE